MQWPSMQWASVSATEPSLTQALAQATDRLLEALGGREPDLVLAFVAAHYRAQFSMLPDLLRREFETATLSGCLSASTIGAGREHEDQPAITLLGAVLPNVKVCSAHLDEKNTPPTYAERSLWEASLQLAGNTPEGVLLLADPFSFASEAFLKGLDRHFPQTVKLGGLASGMEQAGTPCLFLNNTVYDSGVITLALCGDIAIDTIIAQGCRPIGDPMFANRSHENLILEIDGKVPREVLTELYVKLKRDDRQLFTDALFLGVAMEAQREQYQAGDYLIRSILGLDPQSGALWVNAHVPPNSVVQLHLRDAATSAHDIEQLLKRYRASPSSRHAAGAVMFSCLGRGAQLYGHPNHDSNAFEHNLGDVPVGGFFCNGEIGPVRSTTHLHSYTTVFGVFRSKSRKEEH